MGTQRRVVNIINFIRAVEPRSDMDLEEPVRRQIELVDGHGLPATWLLQYDALVQGPFVDLLRALGPEHEIGGWFEVVQPLVEKAGLRWRGRYPWDWHSHVGFSVGYTPGEREKLADVFMAEFRAAFGRYPDSVGSWLMDAHLLGYLHDRYGLIASCNCKDQWGTDGYTLWGGYWNQAFYPSRRNAFMPAQHEDLQLPVPVFRMLGSDPIDQYDAGLHQGANCTEVPAQGVVSLEPVYKGGGGNPAWVRWFFRSLFEGPCLAFAYTQVGQENSFGWPAMATGLQDQVCLLAEKSGRGEVRVETLAASGRWFRQAFAVTPATAVVATEDPHGRPRGSAWYQSRFWRLNAFWEEDRFWLRDLHLFDERYAERYLTAACPSAACTYDTLPLVEGFLWSGEMRAGLFPMRGEGVLHGDRPVVEEAGATGLCVRWPLATSEVLVMECDEHGLTVTLPGEDWDLRVVWDDRATVPFRDVDGNAVRCTHNGFDYRVDLERGSAEFTPEQRCLRFRPHGGVLRLGLDGGRP